MNGANGHYGQAPPSTWQEFRTPDGRVYYYNSATKATQWTKPEEMMTPAEVCFMFTHVFLDHADLPGFIARSGESAVERVYRGGRTQILVPYGDETECLGNARGLQKGTWSDGRSNPPSVSFSPRCLKSSD